MNGFSPQSPRGMEQDVQRFGGFQGFFTKDNVAELTHAAGVEESLKALQEAAQA